MLTISENDEAVLGSVYPVTSYTIAPLPDASSAMAPDEAGLPPLKAVVEKPE